MVLGPERALEVVDGLLAGCETKTVVVKIDRRVLHPVVHKYIKQTRTFKVHDEQNECKVGDIIRFVETRPLSKEKRWRFLGFIERAK